MTYELWRSRDLLIVSKLNQLVPQMYSQGTDLTVALNSTTPQATDIMFTLDADAVYSYELFIAYSASTAADFAWSWETTDNTYSRYITHRAAGAASGLNVGANAVVRRPGATTHTLAQGGDLSGTVDPLNFMSAYDRGMITTTSSEVNVLMVSQGTADADENTILRGGNGTRLILHRIG